MKKIYILLLFACLITGCDSKQKEEVDLTSGSTSKYDKGKIITTKADEQFAKLKKKNEKSENKIIKTVRPQVARFVEEQFREENLENKNLGKLKYKINKKSMSTSFVDDAKYMVRNVGFDYNIKIKKLDKKYNTGEYIEKSKKENEKLKIVEMRPYEKVLVSNINGDNYASSLTTLYTISQESYLLKFESEKMSIAEIIILAEKFAEFIR